MWKRSCRLQAHSRTKSGRPCAWVSSNLVVARNDRATGEDFERRSLPTLASGPFRRTSAAPGRGSKGMFDEAVFEAVVGDDREAPAGPEDPNRSSEPVFECAELIVDCDSQRLEHERRGIVFSAASNAQTADQIDEILGRFEGSGVALRHDRSGEPSRTGKLTILRENPLQVFDRQIREQRGSSLESAASVHSHVQGALAPDVESESALRSIELMGGDAEIEHDAVNREGTQFVGDVVEAPKGGLNELNALAERLESRTCFADGVRIEVQTDQAAVRCGLFEDCGGMATASKRSIHDEGAWFEIELSESFGEEDGFVVGRGHHRGCLPTVRPLGLPGVDLA